MSSKRSKRMLTYAYLWLDLLADLAFKNLLLGKLT